MSLLVHLHKNKIMVGKVVGKLAQAVMMPWCLQMPKDRVQIRRHGIQKRKIFATWPQCLWTAVLMHDPFAICHSAFCFRWMSVSTKSFVSLWMLLLRKKFHGLSCCLCLYVFLVKIPRKMLHAHINRELTHHQTPGKTSLLQVGRATTPMHQQGG